MLNKTLRNNIQLPQIGLGTWQITNRDVVSEVIAHAFNAGYRLQRWDCLVKNTIWRIKRGILQEDMRRCRRPVSVL